ncbi:flavoprotein [Streptomyces sp. NBC_01343]|uniref:flavoprotein n=1 Tax=Streptomyces sp. NBC_01343 TaxID=2903832 RepID=UPI002E10D274
MSAGSPLAAERRWVARTCWHKASAAAVSSGTGRTVGRKSLDGLAALTGHPVRYRYKRPGHPDVWPPADAVLVAPATMNTLNSWALGITGTWLVGFVAEAIGKGIPLTAVPCVNSAYAQHPQFPLSLATLREAGVRVLFGPGGFEPNAPGEKRPYPWAVALDAVGADRQ